MKQLLLIFLLIISEKTFSQDVYPVAVSTNGVLTGKYVIKKHDATASSTNGIPDTISLTDAKNIFALNAIISNRDYTLGKMKIVEYEMMFIEKSDTTLMVSKSENLTDEMKRHLKVIEPGTQIIFQGIKASSMNGLDSSTRTIILLHFVLE